MNHQPAPHPDERAALLPPPVDVSVSLERQIGRDKVTVVMSQFAEPDHFDPLLVAQALATDAHCCLNVLEAATTQPVESLWDQNLAAGQGVQRG